MKAQIKPQPVSAANHRRYIYLGLLILILQLIFHLAADALPIAQKRNLQKDTLDATIERLLNDSQTLANLKFPSTVKRFYAQRSFDEAWVKDDENIKPATDAMLLLDCVRQYGLNKENYHPKELTYGLLHDVLSKENLASNEQKAVFDILLTDAMVSMIYHLHYGAFNPVLTDKILDTGSLGDLQAASFLSGALEQKDLMAAILTVQPQVKDYIELQNYMRLITGQYICDSYEVPQTEVQNIAINMERLRWVNWNSGSFLHINIPSFSLSYQQADTTYEFKVVVGKGKTPTPTLESQIKYLETAPDWKVPQSIFVKEFIPKAFKDSTYFDQNHMAVYDSQENFVKIGKSTLEKIKLHPENYHARQTAGCDNALGKVVFRFPNAYDIYLHDSPEQQLFKSTSRAYSHGCIRVANAELLAELLLKADQQPTKIATLQTAMKAYTKKTFLLKKPVPIIITYLTCAVKDGLLQYYDDVYQLDSSLSLKMYGNTNQLTKNQP
ncbi:L,D-transpeptidase family protein [Pedobacter sp. ASV12]|uniref:L,D-transpeptidase family protein n=1 Tax=Pedobacter sp. ASV12 TaxID=2795120 RepID=UPI0018ED60DD|nr:L,D-transpeptidase family protein [Pedobacter sp. ASV12]